MLTFNDLLRLLFGDNRKRLSRESLWNQVCAYLTPCRQERIRNLFLFFCSSGKDNLSAIECVSFLTFLFWMESIAFITGRYASPLSLFPSLTRSINYKPVALECTSKLFADFHLRSTDSISFHQCILWLYSHGAEYLCASKNAIASDPCVTCHADYLLALLASAFDHNRLTYEEIMAPLKDISKSGGPLTKEVVSFFFMGILRPNLFDEEHKYFSILCNALSLLFGDEIDRRTFLYCVTVMVLLNHKTTEHKAILRLCYACFGAVSSDDLKRMLTDAFVFSSRLVVHGYQDITVHTEEKSRSVLKECWPLLMKKVPITERADVSFDAFCDVATLLLSFFCKASHFNDPVVALKQYLVDGKVEERNVVLEGECGCGALLEGENKRNVEGECEQVAGVSLWQTLFPTRDMAATLFPARGMMTQFPTRDMTTTQFPTSGMTTQLSQQESELKAAPASVFIYSVFSPVSAIGCSCIVAEAVWRHV